MTVRGPAIAAPVLRHPGGVVTESAGSRRRAASMAPLVAAGALGGLGMASVLTHNDLLAFLPGPTPFAMNVGLCACLLAVAIGHGGRRVSLIAGGAAALIGGLTLIEWVLGVSLGIDTLFGGPFRQHVPSGHPGRMAPNSASVVLALGVASILRGRLSTVLASACTLLTLVVAVGYTDPDARALTTLGADVRMAFATALMLGLLSMTLLIVREHAFLARRSVGGTLIRRLIPIVLLVPTVGGVLVLDGIDKGVITAPVGIWAMTVWIIVIGFITIVWISRVVDREERHATAVLSLHAETAANLTEGLCLRREPDGVIVSVNPALERIFGYDETELIGTSTRLLTEENEHLMRAGLREHGTWNRETQTERADGSSFWCSVKASQFHHPDYGTLRLSLYDDVTDRRELDSRRRRAERQRTQAIAELRRSNAELDEFAHVASHDLSEPLRVIGGFVDLLQRRYEGRLDDDADRFIDATVSGVQRMQALIDALLGYSRVGSGDVEREPVDLNAVVAAAVGTLEPKVDESHAEVTVGGMPTVTGDPVLLEQVFQNLISNALKFTNGESPRVSIEALPADGGNWTFRVADNGVGIAPERREQVFGMFKRLQGREQPGTGIGLCMTRRIVEKHGGRIWVEPATPTGSVFAFTIPAPLPT